MSIYSVVFFLFVSSALASSPTKPPTGRNPAAAGEKNTCPLESLNLRREVSYDSTGTSDEDNSPAKRHQTRSSTLLRRTLAKQKLVDSEYGIPHCSNDVSFMESERGSSLGTGSGIASSQPDSEVGREYDFNAQSMLDFDVGHLASPEKRAVTDYLKENNTLKRKAEKAAKKGGRKH